MTAGPSAAIITPNIEELWEDRMCNAHVLARYC